MKLAISKIDIYTPSVDAFADYRVGKVTSMLEQPKVVVLSKQVCDSLPDLPGEIEGNQPSFIADIICYILTNPTLATAEVFIEGEILVLAYENGHLEIKWELSEYRIYASSTVQEHAQLILQFFQDYYVGKKAVMFILAAQSSLPKSAQPEEEESEDMDMTDLEQEEVGETQDFEESSLLDAVSDLEREYMENEESGEEVDEV